MVGNGGISQSEGADDDDDDLTRAIKILFECEECANTPVDGIMSTASRMGRVIHFTDDGNARLSGTRGENQKKKKKTFRLE